MRKKLSLVITAQWFRPESKVDLRYKVLKTRLVRGSPTRQQRELIWGEAEEVLQLMYQIEAAVNLEAVDDLRLLADELMRTPPKTPKVERELGLRLLDFEDYGRAEKLLGRYLEFKMPDDHTAPFVADTQALQQRAIALCALATSRARLRCYWS